MHPTIQMRVFALLPASPCCSTWWPPRPSSSASTTAGVSRRQLLLLLLLLLLPWLVPLLASAMPLAANAVRCTLTISSHQISHTPTRRAQEAQGRGRLRQRQRRRRRLARRAACGHTDAGAAAAGPGRPCPEVYGYADHGAWWRCWGDQAVLLPAQHVVAHLFGGLAVCWLGCSAQTARTCLLT